MSKLLLINYDPNQASGTDNFFWDSVIHNQGLSNNLSVSSFGDEQSLSKCLEEEINSADDLLRCLFFCSVDHASTFDEYLSKRLGGLSTFNSQFVFWSTEPLTRSLPKTLIFQTGEFHLMHLSHIRRDLANTLRIVVAEREAKANRFSSTFQDLIEPRDPNKAIGVLKPLEEWLWPCLDQSGSDSMVRRWIISSLDNKKDLLVTIKDSCRTWGFAQPVINAASEVVEELVMNALRDAVLEQTRIEDTLKLKPRGPKPCTVIMGIDEVHLKIIVQDPYGAFSQEKFFQYLNKVSHTGDFDDIIDKKDSGAGLGLYKVLYHADTMICRVNPLSYTQVCIFLPQIPMIRHFNKAAKSIHFFVSQSES